MTTAKSNVVLHLGQVAVAQRARRLCQQPLTVWLTGLSGAGKSTLAYALEDRLFHAGFLPYVLDGDNIRHGLSSDLGFSEGDRTENIRRVAEAAALMNDAGLIVVTAFISPLRSDRAMARRIIGAAFVEVHVAAPLVICESRDPKGLYRKARRGEIPDFTGISAPYEAPDSADLVVATDKLSIDAACEEVMRVVAARARSGSQT
ncbi:MAG: adenylyl-sulfate kinase [Rhodocyclales bacterium]|nr:adenylyl-sulfate kinase [Rhodocyclales bacterium]